MRYLLIAAHLLFATSVTATTPGTTKHKSHLIFDKTMSVVSSNFYDKSLRGLPWAELTASAKNNLKPGDERVLVDTINSTLKHLKASHTVFLPDTSQEYWALKSIFSKKVEGFRVRQIGAWFKQRGSKWFVQNVFANSQAELADLKPGDEIVAVNGNAFSPVKPFKNAKPLKKLTLTVKRTPWDKPLKIDVATRVESFQDTLLRATKQSTREYVIKKKRVGYFHLWAGTHNDFKLAMEAAIKKLEKNCDSMILDLRDGFGGAGSAYALPFLKTKTTTPLFSKPLIVLINERTRSGKEWLAYILKKSKRAVFIGQRTSGSFLMARTFDIEDKYLLYLAVAPPSNDMPSLEGIGVAPDFEVSQPLIYSAGADPQLYKALTTAGSL